jgi:hypothetical protein
MPIACLARALRQVQRECTQRRPCHPLQLLSQPSVSLYAILRMHHIDIMIMISTALNRFCNMHMNKNILHGTHRYYNILTESMYISFIISSLIFIMIKPAPASSGTTFFDFVTGIFEEFLVRCTPSSTQPPHLQQPLDSPSESQSLLRESHTKSS